MKHLLITLLALFISMGPLGGVFSEERVKQDQKEDNSANAIKLFSSVLRDFLFNPNADELLKIYKDAQYFLCQGKGTLTISIPELDIEEKSQQRDQVLIIFQDDPGDLGLLAISHPAQLGNGWLVVSFKPLPEPRKWLDVWDTENGFSETPLNNKVKGIINDFVIEVNMSNEDFGEEWKPGPMEGSLKQQEYTRMKLNINRKTNEFFIAILDKTNMKLSLPSGREFLSTHYKEQDYEGTCSLSERS